MVILKMFLSTGFIMWLILLCLFGALYISLIKILTLKKVKMNIPFFSIKIRGILKKKNVSDAINFCTSERTPITNIIRRGLKKKKFGRTRIIEELESAARHEISKLEKWLASLAAIASIAPVLGFLGTVLGIISSVNLIQESQGVVKFQDVAPGIWQASSTTIFGLIVGLSATLLYNYFVTRIRKLANDMERVASDILDVLDESVNETNDDEVEV
jgi:biopolymer transport protein ExbB